MPSFPTAAFTRDNVKVRFLEPSVSQSINQRFLGMPRGVYVGYTPQVAPGSPILTLAPDRRLRFSTLKVGAASTAVQVDVFTAQNVTLDFTGHTQFPVFVIARADYAPGAITQAQILTRLAGPVGLTEIGICVVDKPGADLVVSTTVPGQRQPPLAFVGQAFGFMYGGATDDITFAQSVTNEVINARISLATALPAANLSARLALDLAGSYLASILGLRNVNVAGNAQIVSGFAGSANISASFGALTRQQPPALTIPAGGTETTEGAITFPTDPNDKNVCFIIDNTTGQRIVDPGNNPIYGRLAFLAGAIAGTIAFQNAQTAIIGTGTTFTGLQVGDLILGADGNYYSITLVTDNTHASITPAYQGADASGFASSFRRFTVNFFTRGSGAEVAAIIANTTSLRFFFPAWFKLDKAVFDATAFMKRDGERQVEPVATFGVAVKGRALLATAGSLAGALFQVESNQIPLGANNFHTLNFTATNAMVTNAGGGQANISVQGNPGLPGPGANPGPPGLQGGYGPGARVLNPFQLSATFGPGTSGTFSVDFGAPPTGPALSSIVHLVAGIAMYDADPANIGFGNCSWRITSIFKSGTAVGNVSYDLSGLGAHAKARLFLGAAF